jgi:hypothetical protein
VEKNDKVHLRFLLRDGHVFVVGPMAFLHASKYVKDWTRAREAVYQDDPETCLASLNWLKAGTLFGMYPGEGLYEWSVALENVVAVHAFKAAEPDEDHAALVRAQTAYWKAVTRQLNRGEEWRGGGDDE